MAVDAQCLSTLYRSKNNMFEVEDMNNLCGVYPTNMNTNFNINVNNLYYAPLPQNQTENMMYYKNGGIVLSEQESELTCNVNVPSGSRKRPRQDQPSSSLYLQQQQLFCLQQQQQQQFQKRQASPVGVLDIKNSSCSDAHPGFTSTSGRLNPISPVDHFHQQHNLELDTLIHLQHEKLRFTIEESRKRQYREIQNMVQQKVLNKLAEKESELELAKRNNEELEEKIKHLSAENQLWFNAANNNQGIVTSLQATLQQILSQQHQRQSQKNDHIDIEEGYGDSAEVVEIIGDDAQSCCYGGEKEVTSYCGDQYRNLCKGCQENDVSILLLPCRHLCLCKNCESSHDTCLICNSVKDASIQIFIS